MEQKLKGLYEFGPFRLDAGERLLLRAGEPVALTPKAFDLLLALVEQPGHLLEKEALLKTVWPDSFVEENNLADNISKLRKVLGENGQKFIETVPRRGYRFVAAVSHLSEANATPLIKGMMSQPASPSVRFHRRPELMLIAGGFLALLFIGDWFWQRTGRGGTEAKQLEFKGNFYLSQWTEAEIRKALDYYQRAAALNPRSASAYAGQAAAWIFLTDLYVAPREAMPQAQAAAAHALQLDETDAGAHISMGAIKLQYEWDWARAEREFQRALHLAPDEGGAHQLYGWYLISLNRCAEAQSEMQRAVDADARSGYNLWNLGLSFYFARAYDQAIEQYRRSLALDARSYWPHMLLGWACAQQGKFDEAIAAAQQASRINDSPQTLASLGHAYAQAGRRDEAQKVLAELKALALRKYVSPYDVATVYAGLGETGQTFDWLEKAYEDRSGWLAWWLKVDPKFDSFRSTPQFQDLLRRVGLAQVR